MKHARIATPRIRTLDWTPVRLAAITAILASAALIAAPAALADGDPASDVLVESVVFNPIDGVSLASQARLEAVLNASARAGFPIRVALIASAKDLGTVTPLWDKPGKYAAYLDTELSLSYRGQVLVVMPNGFGLHGPAQRAARGDAGRGRRARAGAGAGRAAGNVRARGRATAGGGRRSPDPGLRAGRRRTLSDGGTEERGHVCVARRGRRAAPGRAADRARVVGEPAGTPVADPAQRRAMTKRAFVLSLASTGHTHHATPAGWFLAVVVLLVVLYILWRSGRLRRLLDAIRESRGAGAESGPDLGAGCCRRASMCGRSLCCRWRCC